jgi:hypothetical protein
MALERFARYHPTAATYCILEPLRYSFSKPSSQGPVCHSYRNKLILSPLRGWVNQLNTFLTVNYSKYSKVKKFGE